MPHTRIVFLVLPSIHLIDLAGPLQVFHEAMELGADFSIEYCSLKKDTLSSTNLPLGKISSFEEVSLKERDYLFIPGAETKYLLSPGMKGEKKLFDWLRQAHDAGAFVCSVCTGAFLLAQAGLLDGRKCTTHWQRTEVLKQGFPAARVEEDILFTEDDRILTSAGVTTGIDLALFIVSRLADEHLSYQVARTLVVYLRREGDESQHSIYVQYRSHIHSGVHKVQDYLQENIRQKVSLVQLADQACMSERNLTRTFKKETGITVNQYTVLLRKELLKRLVKNPDISRKQMARQCGLKSERQVIRILNTVQKNAYA